VAVPWGSLTAAVPVKGQTAAGYPGDHGPYDEAYYRFLEPKDGSTRAELQREVAQKLLDLLGFQSLLDVGCGQGWLVEALRNAGCEAVGLDVSLWAVQHAAEDAVVYLGWAGDLPFEANQFEVVLLWKVLEHLSEEEAFDALMEAKRVARDLVVICVTVEHYINDPTHITVRPAAWWENEFRRVGLAVEPGLTQELDDWLGQPPNRAYVLTKPLRRGPSLSSFCRAWEFLREKLGWVEDVRIFLEPGGHPRAGHGGIVLDPEAPKDEQEYILVHEYGHLDEFRPRALAEEFRSRWGLDERLLERVLNRVYRPRRRRSYKRELVEEEKWLHDYPRVWRFLRKNVPGLRDVRVLVGRFYPCNDSDWITIPGDKGLTEEEIEYLVVHEYMHIDEHHPESVSERFVREVWGRKEAPDTVLKDAVRKARLSSYQEVYHRLREEFGDLVEDLWVYEIPGIKPALKYEEILLNSDASASEKTSAILDLYPRRAECVEFRYGPI
jgi:SAM-dependent methyltransferase